MSLRHFLTLQLCFTLPSAHPQDDVFKAGHKARTDQEMDETFDLCMHLFRALNAKDVFALGVRYILMVHHLMVRYMYVMAHH